MNKALEKRVEESKMEFEEKTKAVQTQMTKFSMCGIDLLEEWPENFNN